jgi:DNA-binding response OmpR family regulator
MSEARCKVVLVVDDDPQIQKLVADYMSNFEFTVAAARSRQALFDYLELQLPALVILDLHLPDGVGFDIARELRARFDLPIIILTGSQDEYDRIVGLEVGADDYMSKPFAMRELLARIRAVLRRYPATASVTVNFGSALRFAGWQLALDTRVLRHESGQVHTLTDQEFRLLKVMLDHPPRVLSRDFLLEASRVDAAAVFDRSVDYHVMKLRRKIERDTRRPQLIKTERNAGYLFNAAVERG